MTHKERAHEFAQEHIESGEWMAVIPPLAALLAEVAAEARRSERDEVLSAASCVDAMALAKARAEGRRQGLEEAIAYCERGEAGHRKMAEVAHLSGGDSPSFNMSTGAANALDMAAWLFRTWAKGEP